MNWRGGKGDVLREFVDAAQRWNIKICYYTSTLYARCSPYPKHLSSVLLISVLVS